MNVAIISENSIYCIALEHIISGFNDEYKCTSFNSMTKIVTRESHPYHYDCILISKKEFFTNVCLVCKFINLTDNNNLKKIIVFGSGAEKLKIDPSIGLLDISGSVETIKLRLRHILRTVPKKLTKIISPLPPMPNVNGGVIRRIYKGDNIKRIASTFNLSPKTISGMHIRMLRQLGLNKVDFEAYFDGIPPCLFRKNEYISQEDLVSMAVYRMVWKCIDKSSYRD